MALVVSVFQTGDGGLLELAELRAWFLEYDSELWDRQIEEDVRAGRLDHLGKKALDFYDARKAHA